MSFSVLTNDLLIYLFSNSCNNFSHVLFKTVDVFVAC